MSESRVAVIEIGSRAIRLLVADISEANGLEPVATDWQQTHLAAAVALGDPDNLLMKLQETRRIVDAFRKLAEQNGVAKVAVFGTEALRQVKEKCPLNLSEVLPDVHVLDKKSEAECSLLAAVKGDKNELPGGRQVLAVDQGGGSIELAIGRLSKERDLALSEYRSYRLGAETLIGLYRTAPNTRSFRDVVAQRIGADRFAEVDRSAQTYVLGSVATNSAWLFVRRGEHERYDPRRVQGFRMPVAKVEQLITALEKEMMSNPSQVRYFIDPRNPNSDELEIIFTGLVALIFVLKQFGMTEYTVSSHGMRYGMAWQLARGKRVK